MRNNDDLLLENLYQEGIWDRLKGQGSGIKQGAGTLLKNIGGKLTGDTGDRPSARSEYAKAQQGSLLKSFVQKVQKEIVDFKNDLKIFKVDANPDTLQKNFPIIAQRLKEIENLDKFLTSPTQATSTQTTSSQAGRPSTTTQPSPSTNDSETPNVTTNVQDYLNLKDAAEYLKVSETELQNKAATGKIKSTIISGKPLFKKEDLDSLNKPEEQPKTETPATEVGGSKTVATGNTPKKGDKATYLNDPNYIFNGNAWEYKGKEVTGEKLINNLNKAWEQQKSAKPKPAAKAAVKATPKKTVTKAKPVATKKPATKANVKAKTTTMPSGSKVTETKLGQNKTRYTYESYNPFNDFLKECNLI